MNSTEKKIHILHVIPGLMPGGMELAMAQVISRLSNHKMQHSIACLKGEPEISDRLPKETRIFCFNAKPNEAALPFRLARLVRKLKPDVIHARNWGAWPDMALGRFLTWPVPPMIYSFHGLGKAGYMPWRRRIASQILVHLTSELFTVSRQSLEMLVNHWGWSDNKSKIIPNGVDTQRYFPFVKKKNKQIVIGSVGNLRTVKNHVLILRACGKLISQGIKLEIRIAGEGNQRNVLEKEAKSLGIESCVHLPGRVEDIPGFLNTLDIFVLSSDSEQHPNALNEAMACGVASIATRVGCVEDLLDSGRCGRIIEPGDERGLAKAIHEFSENPELRTKSADAGLKHVRSHYSLEVMVKRYEHLYFQAGKKGY